MQIENRHQAILEVIAANSVGRQDELARLLTERGFSVTQASVSRDLEKLGVVKINGRYMRPAVTRFGSFGPVSFAEAGENLVAFLANVPASYPLVRHGQIGYYFLIGSRLKGVFVECAT